ncbi:helix-turn-helix domain-containing protein [Natronolimnohabitans sp. A-GB9]|uniref:helix-turn-helix domain-containing protein n=1 Tax=Natronolimnohabitans sp. A-GB9 TaxID=3069757 RepID=UPI0027B24CD6|nr:helix-turn-helix domain-containing protein [Natronolimnohabitans sp. A-GB9]MDQ2052221.1 helix-turn-helix domain-containing protein [Natronolimnohabitans sp. A-GB9]
MTERQREVVSDALARGYYDWPREITNERLAEELGISRATLHTVSCSQLPPIARTGSATGGT